MTFPSAAQWRGASFIATGARIEDEDERLRQIYEEARVLCPDLFVAEETRELEAVYERISLGFIDKLRKELASKLDLPREIFLRDRFSVHGCGPVGLHDDFFRYPRFYFAIVVVHSGELGLVDESTLAQRHRPGDIILLDPRRKHGLIAVGETAEDHVYESTHSPVHDPKRQFMFIDFDVSRPDLRARFRASR